MLTAEKPNPVYRLYVVAGDQGEIRLIDTYYPERSVRALVLARNHTLCAQLTDIANVKAFGDQRIESLPEYLHQVADDANIRRLMSNELRRDVVEFLASREREEGRLDGLDRQLLISLEQVA
jgi:hypothetical protein